MLKQNKLLTLLNLVLVGFLPIASFATKFAYVVLYFIGIDYNLYELYLPPYFLLVCITQSYLLRYCKHHRGMMYGLLASDILSYTLTYWHDNILTYNILVLSCLFVSLLCFIKTIYIIIKYDTTRKLFKCNR